MAMSISPDISRSTGKSRLRRSRCSEVLPWVRDNTARAWGRNDNSKYSGAQSLQILRMACGETVLSSSAQRLTDSTTTRR
ncbi:hypothetical protein D3C73_1497090 [compost metagenome]